MSRRVVMALRLPPSLVDALTQRAAADGVSRSRWCEERLSDAAGMAAEPDFRSGSQPDADEESDEVCRVMPRPTRPS